MLGLPTYTILETAYEGSETIVYRGYRNTDRTPVAVKGDGCPRE